MACESRSRQLALIFTAVGIPATANRRGFYAALAAGTALGTLLLGRWLARPKKLLSNQRGSVPTLTGQLQLDPIPAGQLNDQQCSGCRSTAHDKRGLWYAIRGSPYCPDCASTVVRQGGFSLGVRSASIKSGVVFYPDDSPSVAINLKPGRVRVGVAQVEGHPVLRARDRQETGLTITPAVELSLFCASVVESNFNRSSTYNDHPRMTQMRAPFSTGGDKNR